MAKRLLNLDDMAVKRSLMSEIGTLRGLWDVELKQRRQTRSLDQNAYYHVAVVEPFCQWLCEEWGEQVSHDQAHETLRDTILGFHSIEGGGCQLRIPKTTTKLDVAEFSEYLENCIQWLATFCQIAVVPSELFYQGATESKPKS